MSERLCSLCHSSLNDGDEHRNCESCAADAHADCWRENGGCGTYGCSQVPAPVQQAVATPVTYWGQETKECPSCGEQIRAAALRCRHCNTQFETAAPLTREQYRDLQNRGASTTKLGDKATWYFVSGLIPFVSLLTLLVGGLYLRAHRKEFSALPPMQRLLIRLGLGLSGLWAFVALLLLML